jgi:hypothetical protein
MPKRRMTLRRSAGNRVGLGTLVVLFSALFLAITWPFVALLLDAGGGPAQPAPAGPAPAGPTRDVVIRVLLVLVPFGGSLCALCWVVFLNALERVEVDPEGLTHLRPGRASRRLAWADVARIRMQGLPSRLVLSGRAGGPTIKVRACLTGYDGLLGYLRSHLDWERLIRAAEGPEGSDSPAAGVPLLPAIYPRRGALLVPTIGLGLSILLGGLAFLLFDREGRPNPPPPTLRDRLGEAGLWIIPPLIAGASFWMLLTSWLRLRVERDAIEVDYLGRSRRVPLTAIGDLQVEARSVRTRGGPVYYHCLLV